jgi:hypothetical protein
LWRGSALQITRTTPLRFTILQFLQILLTDALTFISTSLSLVFADQRTRAFRP